MSQVFAVNAVLRVDLQPVAAVGVLHDLRYARGQEEVLAIRARRDCGGL